jgi:hypothetical protein
MKRFFVYSFLVAVAACTYDSQTRVFDPTTGTLRGDATTRITVDPIAVNTPGVAVKIGDGHERTTNAYYEVIDINGDGVPDLVRHVATGKYYRITGWTEVTRPPAQVIPGRSFVLDVYENPVSSPIAVTPTATAGKLASTYGYDQITAKGSGTYAVQNILVFSMTPSLLDPAQSQVSVGVRQSSDWQMENVVAHPELRYEILGVEPTKAGEPYLFVTHLEGAFVDVARFLAANGTEQFHYDADSGVDIGFEVSGRELRLFLNGTEAGVVDL